MNIAKEIGEALAAGAPNAGRRAAAFMHSSAYPVDVAQEILSYVPEAQQAAAMAAMRAGHDTNTLAQRQLWEKLIARVEDEDA